MQDNFPQSITDNQTCPATAYQSVSVCVPVTVSPFVKTGATVTKCCGNPVVTAGKNVCGGIKNGTCTFTISQDICVAVPVAFGAIANVGDNFVSCNRVSEDDICSDCGATPTPVVDKV